MRFGIASNPTAELIAQQITKAFPWNGAPRFLIRDRHWTCGQAFCNRVAAMAIVELPTAPRSPWQSGYVERLIGSVRKECLEHVIALNEQQLRCALKSCFAYYNQTRTHLAFEKKDAPEPSLRMNDNHSPIAAIPEIGGLHHRYQRVAD